MIDEFFLSPTVHIITGSIVLLTTLIALLVTGIRAWRKQPLSRLTYAALLVAQLALMVQVLIGIKLLDQGLGPMQLYIHYVGGLGPLLFLLLFYWLPRGVREQRWTAPSLSAAAFLFAVMAFGIGASYVPGGI